MADVNKVISAEELATLRSQPKEVRDAAASGAVQQYAERLRAEVAAALNTVIVERAARGESTAEVEVLFSPRMHGEALRRAGELLKAELQALGYQNVRVNDGAFSRAMTSTGYDPIRFRVSVQF